MSVMQYVCKLSFSSPAMITSGFTPASGSQQKDDHNKGEQVQLAMDITGLTGCQMVGSPLPKFK